MYWLKKCCISKEEVERMLEKGCILDDDNTTEEM